MQLESMCIVSKHKQNFRYAKRQFSPCIYFKHSVGLRIDKGLGASCPGQFILPRISNRMDKQQFLLHHLPQKYLVERDINFISVNLRCLLQTISWVTYWQGVGGKPSRAVFLAPSPEFQREWISAIFITSSREGGKINQSGQLASHPSDKDNRTER